MGLGEFFQQTATTILLLKADTSDAKRALKDLAGEEKKAAEAAIKMAEDRNKAMDRVAKGITATTTVMKLSKVAVDVLGDAWKTYEKQALAAGGADAAKARSFRSALNEMGGAIDHIKGAVGRLVVGLEPLIRAAAFIVEKAAWVIENVPGSMDGFNASGDRLAAKYRAKYGEGVYGQYAYGAAYAQRDLLQSLGIAGSGLIQAGAIQTADVANRTRPRKPTGGGADNSISYETESRTGGYGGYGGALGGAGVDFGLGALAPVLNATDARINKQQGIITSIFGEPKEFDLYAAKFQMLADSVGVFSGALQAGFEAWKSGSMSATEALEGVFKATISGLASTMFAHALEEGALAVGALARGIGGNPQGFVEAAAHGKAAAGYAAAGIGIGAIARGLGGGGSGGGGGGSAGGYGGPPASFASGDHRSGSGETRIIYVGEGWTTTPGEQRQRFARAQRKSRREIDAVEGRD